MSVGRISGPLLKANLLRNGIDLAFETDLLYLDVSNLRVGINTSAPAYDLDVDGIIRALNLKSTSADIGNINISANTINTDIGHLNLSAATSGDRVKIGNAEIPNIYGDVRITGNLHATGNITSDGGSITFGDSDADNVVFNADINSNVVPNITDTYDLGTALKRWNTINVKTINTSSSNVTTSEIGTLTVTTLATIASAKISNLTSGRVVLAGTAGQIQDSGNLTFVSNVLTVNGSQSVTGTLGISGLSTLATAQVSDLTSGRITYAGANGRLKDSGNLTFDGTLLTVTGNESISGTLSVSGLSTLAQARVSDLTQNRITFAGANGRLSDAASLTFNGTTFTVTTDVVLGTSGGSNTVTLNGKFIGNLLPNTTTQDVGSLSNYWRNVYISGQSNIGGLRLETNRIEALALNGGITIAPNGTGLVAIDSSTALAIPKGNIAARPGTPATGMIRYNTELSQFEGYNVGGWSSLGGVRDVSGTTYIIPETSPGADERTLYFYADSVNVGTWSSDKLTVLSPGFKIPTGTNANRPTGEAGFMRYNTELEQFEGFAAGGWSSLGGVKSVDGQTYIIAESSPGISDDKLFFYTNGVLSATIGTLDTEIKNILYVSNNTNAISSVTGSIVTDGGIGVAQSLYVGGNTEISGTFEAKDDVTLSPINGNVAIQPSGTGSITITSGVLGSIDNVTVGGTTPANGTFTNLVANTGVNLSPTGSVTINPTVASSVNNVNIGASTRGTGAFTTLTSNGVTSVSNVTESTSTASGALVVTGGVGIGKNLYVGGKIESTGTITANSSLIAKQAVELNPNNFNISIAPTGTGTATINPAVNGNIDNMIIGATTPRAGTFTDVVVNGSLAISGTSSINLAPTGSGTVTIDPESIGTIDNMTIGATTPRGATFTSIKDTSLTTDRIVIVGADGELIDDGNLSFNSVSDTLSTTNVSASSVTANTIKSSSLTAGRVTFATTNGQLIDSAGLTYNSSTSSLSTINVNSTEVNTTHVTSSALTQGRLVLVGTSGLLVDDSTLYVSGGTLHTTNVSTTDIDSATLDTTGNVTIGGTLEVTGNTTLSTVSSSGQATLESIEVTNDVDIGGDLNVTGDIAVYTNTFNVSATTGNTTIGGVLHTNDLTDSTSISSGSVIIDGGVGIAKNLYVGGNIVTGSATLTSTLTATSAVDLSPTNFNVTVYPKGTGILTIAGETAGTIDNMIIGGVTPNSATFTSVVVNSDATFNGTNATISLAPAGSGTVIIDPDLLGSIDNMAIGANTPANGKFTNLVATQSANLTTSGTVTINPTLVGAVNNVNIGASTRGTGAFTTLAANGVATFTDETDSSNTTTGAVQIAGGVGIAKNLYVGGNIVTGSATVSSTFTATSAVVLSPNNFNITIEPTGTGTVSIRPGTTGAINNMVIGDLTPRAATFTTLTTQGNTTLNGNGSIVNLTPTGAGYVTINPGSLGTINNMEIGATTASTGTFTDLEATTSATFDVSGDVSIQPTGTVTINPNTLGSMDNISIGENARSTAKFTTVDINSTATFTDATQSTSTTTGAVQVAGGVGIVKNLYVGGNTSIAGNLTVLGTTTTVNSTVTTITDPVITLGGTADTGLKDNANRGAQLKYAVNVSANILTWTADGSANVVANLDAPASTYGFKAGDKINILGSGVTNLDGIGTVASVTDDEVTFTASGLVATSVTANVATVGLSKNGFFGYHESIGKFTYIPDAAITNNVVVGDIGDAKFRTLELVNSLAVLQGGTGRNDFIPNGIVYGNGVDALQVTSESSMGVGNATASYGILTTDTNNVPVWTDVIDCGTY
jgi:hypothetical protein